MPSFKTNSSTSHSLCNPLLLYSPNSCFFLVHLLFSTDQKLTWGFLKDLVFIWSLSEIASLPHFWGTGTVCVHSEYTGYVVVYLMFWLNQDWKMKYYFCNRKFTVDSCCGGVLIELLFFCCLVFLSNLGCNALHCAFATKVSLMSSCRFVSVLLL